MMTNTDCPDKSLRGLIEDTFREGRKQLVQHGEIMPMFTLIGNEAVVVPGDFQSDAHKDLMALAIRELVKLHEAHTVLLMSETWSLPRNTPRDIAASLYAKYGSISNMPQRVEYVMVTAETHDGQSWLCMAPIIRNGRAVRLGAIEYVDADGLKSSGRFARWFEAEVPTTVEDILRPEADE